MVKPPFSYYGGKQRIAAKVVEQLLKISHRIYAEPFAGGCAVLYKKPIPNVPADEYREAINDTNELIVNLYQVARTHPEELTQLLQWTPYSRLEHRRAVDICENKVAGTPVERAWALVVNAEMSFAHKLNSTWGVRRSSENSAYTWANKRGRIAAAIARLEHVAVDYGDALDFISRWDAPDALFYCDPPYPGTNQGHYKGYTIDDFEALCRKLDSIQGSYVLSCYDQGDIAPATTQDRIEIEATCSAAIDSNSAKRTEVLWVCDRSKGGRRVVNETRQIEQMSLI